MTSISLLTIEGTLDPQRIPTPCSREVAYGQAPPTEIFFKESNFDLEKSIYLNENFEFYLNPKDPSFWKQRVFIQMVASPHIVSMAFIPYSGATCQTLFMQKINLIKKITGFVAPYLSLADQKNYGAIVAPPFCHMVHDEASILDSLRELDHSEEIAPILRNFLHDPETVFLAITYLDAEQPISRGWLKDQKCK